MKSWVLLLVIVMGTILSVVALKPGQLFASGTESYTTLRNGERVRVYERDGVMYLTTDIDSSTVTATTPASRRINFGLTSIVIPEGYARSIVQLINGLLSFVMVIAALLVFFYLIMGAFQWITSGGDKGKIEQARQKLVAAVIGIIIVASSYAILLLVLRFLGFASLEEVFTNIKTITGENIEVVDDATPSGSATPSAIPVLIEQ